MSKSSNNNYLVDKINFLPEYLFQFIGKISARFNVPSISVSKIKYNCLRIS